MVHSQVTQHYISNHNIRGMHLCRQNSLLIAILHISQSIQTYMLLLSHSTLKLVTQKYDAHLKNNCFPNPHPSKLFTADITLIAPLKFCVQKYCYRNNTTARFRLTRRNQEDKFGKKVILSQSSNQYKQENLQNQQSSLTNLTFTADKNNELNTLKLSRK